MISQEMEKRIHQIACDAFVTLMTRMMFRSGDVYSEGWAVSVIEKAIAEGATHDD
jgi:hypothetical protein